MIHGHHGRILIDGCYSKLLHLHAGSRAISGHRGTRRQHHNQNCRQELPDFHSGTLLKAPDNFNQYLPLNTPFSPFARLGKLTFFSCSIFDLAFIP